MPRKRKRKPGGWPRHATVPPAIQKGKSPPKDDATLAIKALGRTSGRGAAALQSMARLAAELADGTIDDAKMEARMGHLCHLLATWPALVNIRPCLRAVREALDAYTAAHPDVPQDGRGGDEAQLKLLDYVVPRVFDKPLVERLDDALEKALLSARNAKDADALAAGALYASEARAKGGPSCSDPLFGALVVLAVREATRFTDTLEDAGIPLDPARLQALRESPTEINNIVADPKTMRKFGKRLRQDPVLRRQADIVMQETEKRFFEAVADGTVQACLSPEECEPLVPDLTALINRIAAASPKGKPTGQTAEAATAEFIALYQKYATDAANEAAFARFTQALRAEAAEAEKANTLDGNQLSLFAHLWTDHWQHADAFRIRLTHASIGRVTAEFAEAPEQSDAPTET